MMTEGRFWDAIALTGGSCEQQSLDRLQRHLRDLPDDEILDFHDRLSYELRRMDLKDIATRRWRDVSEPRWLPRFRKISADGFLYARCAAVLEGRETVDAIVADHSLFARPWDTRAEALLAVGVDAWEAAVGRDFDYERASEHSYETGTNPAGGWS